jgi:hypothetical protein
MVRSTDRRRIVKFTLAVQRTIPAFTNQWNDFSGLDWQSMTRGEFATEQSACEWARDHLIHGAPFQVLAWRDVIS